MIKRLPYLLLPILLISCVRENNNFQTGRQQAYVPVYISAATGSEIKIESPRPTEAAGKIYVFGNYLFQNDINNGIHIINAADRANPRKIAFIKIPLSTEVAVKGNFLYSNNLADLVTLDISNPVVPVLVNRTKDVFPLSNQQYPPFNNVSFECADPGKGIVAKWELKTVDNPKCRR